VARNFSPPIALSASISSGSACRRWRWFCCLPLIGLCLHLVACSIGQRVTNPVFPNPTLERQASNIAQQPMPFHIGVALAQYLDEDEPIYFLVADDLQHASYSACTRTTCFFDGVEALNQAYEDCADLRPGSTCSLLYLRRKPLASDIRFKDSISYKLLRGECSIAPAEAHGKIIYLPGFSGWYRYGYNFPPAMTDDEISPALQALEALGWDVDVLNLMHLDRPYLWYRPEMLSELLDELITTARREGYRRVILYGGSRGGAEIIQAVVGGASPDAIALMEPDWHGPKFDSRGGFNDDHGVRASEISELTALLPTRRIAFVFFRNSRWYGDIERADIQQALESTGADYLLIAKPPLLDGHGASWSRRFANVYSACLHRFFLAEIDSMQDCEPPPVDETAYENWATSSRITAGDYQRLSGDEIRALFDGKGLCRYQPGENSTADTGCTIWQGSESVSSFTSEFDFLITLNALLDYRQSGYCRHNGFYSPTYRCNQVYRIEENLFAIVPEDRDRIFWYRIVDPEAVLEQQRRARYACENHSKLTSGSCRKL
jgi:hypothetical protein